jgi:hypothetical protein
VRREPDRVRALRVPTRGLGLTGLQGSCLGVAVRRVLRRLLVVGGLLICGWLLASIQSAHAADVGPPPAASAVDVVHAATTHTPDTHARDHDRAGTPPATGRRAATAPRTARGGTGLQHANAAAHLSSAPPAGLASLGSSTRSARVRSAAPAGDALRGMLNGAGQSVHQAPAAPDTSAIGAAGSTTPSGARLREFADTPASVLGLAQARRSAPAPDMARAPDATRAAAAQTVPDFSPALNSQAPGRTHAAPTPALLALGLFPAFDPATPPHPPPVPGSAQMFRAPPTLNAPLGPTPATTFGPEFTGLDPVTAFNPGMALNPAAALPGATVLDPLPVFDEARSVSGSAPAAIGALTGLIQYPSDVVSTVAAVAIGPTGVLTGSFGTVLTTPLGAKALGALTAPLKGVLGQLGRLTTGLIPQALGLLTPAERLLKPVGGIVLPERLVDNPPVGALLPPPASSTACPTYPSRTHRPWPAGAAPAGSGHAAAGGSAEQQIAQAPAIPVDQALGSGPRAVTSHLLCGQWPQPARSPDVARAHMSGQSNGPFTPGDSNNPVSGTSKGALPTSSQLDGTGDTPHSWQARVPETFVPVRSVAVPAVRTAADEPAYSPD